MHRCMGHERWRGLMHRCNAPPCTAPLVTQYCDLGSLHHTLYGTDKLVALGAPRCETISLPSFALVIDLP